MRHIFMVFYFLSLADGSLFGEPKEFKVEKIKECKTMDECAGQSTANKKRMDIKNDSIVIYGAEGEVLKTRPLKNPKPTKKDKKGNVLEREGILELVRPAASDKGAIIRRAKINQGYPKNKSVEYEILDESGNTLLTIPELDASAAMEPAPNNAYFVGYTTVESYEGEPFIFFDKTGRAYAKHEYVLNSKGSHAKGSYVNIGFSSDGEFVAISVKGAGLAVFDKNGRLLWKKLIPGWLGREKPEFFPNSSKFVVKGGIGKHEFNYPEDRPPTRDELNKMPLEEKRKLLMPKRYFEEKKGLYCYSTDKDEPLWFAEGWGGLMTMNPTKDFVAIGQAGKEVGYDLGVFSPTGFIKKWSINSNVGEAYFSWLGEYLFYGEAKIKRVRKGTKVDRKIEPRGILAVRLIHPEQDAPIWMKKDDKGFDFQLLEGARFVIEEEGRASLFEIK